MDRKRIEAEGEPLEREAAGLARELREIRGRVMDLRRRLPDPSERAMDLDEAYSPRAELAVALECAARDDLDMAVQRLEKALAATPGQMAEDWERARQPLPRARPRLDLGRFSESARRAIYEDLVATRFTPCPPDLTPDDFELQVVYLFGRWMVTFRKLWEAAGPLAASPWELLIVGTDERKEPVYAAV